MRTLGIFAKTFEREEVRETLEAVHAHGFTSIQFNMSCLGLSSMPDHIDPTILLETRVIMDHLDLSMAGLSATFNMCHPNEEVRLDGLRRMEVLAKGSALLGNKLLTLCTGTRDPMDKWKHHPDNATTSAWLDMCRTMEMAIDIADKYDLYLGIEPELANVVANAAKAQQLLLEMGSDRLRIILDPANLFERASKEEVKNRISDAVNRLGSYIGMAHVKDRAADGQFVAPGKGVVPFAYFLKELDQAGLDVPLVAHGFTEAEVPDVAHFLKNV